MAYMVRNSWTDGPLKDHKISEEPSWRWLPSDDKILYIYWYISVLVLAHIELENVVDDNDAADEDDGKDDDDDDDDENDDANQFWLLSAKRIGQCCWW